MQIEEIDINGLKREYEITIPSSEFHARVDKQLQTLRASANIKGFRPGKVPVTYLRKVYGPQIMYDVLNEMITAANQNLFESNKLTLASRPEVDFKEESEQFEKNRLEGKDIAYRIRFEVMPQVEIESLEDLSLERHAVEISDDDIKEMVNYICERSLESEARPEGEAAQEGDYVTFDLIVTPKGEGQEARTEAGKTMFLGSSRDKGIRQISDILIGMKVGEEKELESPVSPKVLLGSTPEGQEASYGLVLQAIQVMNREETIKKVLEALSLADEEALQEYAREQLKKIYDSQARQYLKRALFDKLDALYTFDVPSVLEEQEFARVWREWEEASKKGGVDEEDKTKDEETLRKEYRAIANRRVRLAVVLGEVGRSANVAVTEEDMKNEISGRISSYATTPEVGEMMWKYFTQNKEILREIHSNLVEEKTTDHILSLVKVVDMPISTEAFDLLEQTKDNGLAAGVAAVSLQENETEEEAV